MSDLTGLRKRLHTPGPVLAAMMTIPDPAIATLLGSSGLDVVMLDGEHGAYTISSLQACMEAVHATAASVIVRTGPVNTREIQQLLDLGAEGVLVSHVETAEEAATIIRATRYPPEGARGLGVGRANRYGLDLLSTVEEANPRIAAMAIIESVRGVENAAEIMAVPGLDAIVIGGGDLATELGTLDRPEDARLGELIEQVAACARQSGMRIAGAPRSAKERDSELVVCFSDTEGIGSGARAAVEAARAA